MQFNALIRACDHRVCCNINTAIVIPITRTSATMCQRVSVHVFEQLQQRREKGGRTATESASNCRSSLSKKQQLKAQIISSSFVFPFFPKEKYIKTEVHKSGCNHTAAASGTSPTHRACIFTCARGRLGTPQPVHATTRGKERAEENR